MGRDLVNIQQLILENNSLTKLDSQIFSGMKHLNSLDLESNKLTQLHLVFQSKTVLHNLVDLEGICIDDGVCDTKYSVYCPTASDAPNMTALSDKKPTITNDASTSVLLPSNSASETSVAT